MNTKHTPGPWTDGRFVGMTGADRAGLQIGFVCSPHEDRRAEFQANARLIAAAPTMLEALVAMEREFGKAPVPVGRAAEVLEIQAAARYAIAKATGEQSCA